MPAVRVEWSTALPSRDDLGEKLGLYVYVPIMGCGRLSLPAIRMAVRGSLGSKAEPTSCCDSGGNDIDKGFMSMTCEPVPNGIEVNW